MIPILYVDDEPDLLELAQIFLEQTGEFRVRTSTSAEEVLANPEILSFDAILSDYQMPGMDGIAFLKEIRKRSSDLPFILFTGRGREEVVIEALNNGADFYIQKGGDPKAQFAELANKIRYAVNRRRAEKELQKKSDELNASYEQIAANEEELRQQLDELTVKQEALKISEEKFRAFTENVPDLTTISDANGNYRYISPSIQRITGQGPDALLGKTYAGISSFFGIVSEDAELLLTSGRSAIKKPGEPVPVPPFRVRDVYGKNVFIEGTVTYLPDVKGIQGLLFHGRDITDRVKAEEEIAQKNRELRLSYEQLTASEEELRGQYEELAFGEKRIRDSEEKFRSLFEKTHEALIVYAGRTFLDCNQLALELFGYTSKDEFLSLTPNDIFPPLQPDGQDSGTAGKAHVKKALLEGTDHFEWVHKKKDGALVPCDVLLSVFELDGKQMILASIRDISDRKWAEEQLELLKISVDRSSDEVFWMDFEGSILYVNDAACRTTGYSREELCSMKLFALDPDFPQEIWDASVDDLRTKKTQYIQTRHRRKDGTLIDVEIVAVYVSKGDREYSFAFVRDITERKRAERILAESEERYRTLVDSSFDGIAIHQDGKLVFVNQTGVRMMGLSDPAVLIGKAAIEIIHPDDRALIAERIRISPEKSLELIHERFLRADGSTIDVDVATTPCTWQGRPATYVTFRDISIQKKAEAALRESEENYRSLIELAPIAIVVHRDGKNVYANPEAIRMIKAKVPEDIIGKDILTFVSPDYQVRTLGAIRKMSEEGVMLPPQEQRIVAVDGEVLTVEIAAKPVNFQGLASIMVLMRDITEQKKTKDALYDSRQMLQSVLDTIPQRVFWKDKNSVFLGCNRQNARDAGFSDPAQMVGKTDFDYTTRDVAELYRADDRQVMETGEGRINYEEPQVRPDGSTAWLRTSKVPLRDKERNVVGVLGTYEDITEYKRSQEALRESEEKYRLLVETTSDFIWEVDTGGKYTYISPKIRDMLGFEPKEIIGKTPFDLMTPADASRIAAEFLDYVKREKPFSGLVNVNLHKDGSTVIIETSAAPFFDRNGAFAGYRGIDRDVTKRKKTEEALIESENRFRNIVETTSEWIWEMDLAGHHTFSNPAIERIIGYSLEEIQATDINELMHPDDQNTLKELLESSIRLKKGWRDVVVRWRHKNGSWCYLESNSIPVFDSDGTLTGFRGADRDITGRKGTEQALRESEEKYRTLVENAHEAIAIVQEWKIVFVNQRGADMLGRPVPEIEGQMFMDFIWPEDRDRLKDLHAKRIAGASVPQTYDFRITGAGGRPVWVSNSTTGISWQGKASTLSLMTDITERKFAEAALQESEETFRRVIEGAPEAIYIGADWKFVYLNPAALRLLGATSGNSLIGTPFLDRIHPRFHEAIKNRVNGLYHEKVAASTLEEVYVRLDGTEVEVEVSAVPFRYMGKDGALVFVWDITSRKSAEQARRKSEAEYRRILDTMQDAYVRTDRNGIVTMVNPSAVRMYGYASSEEMIGMPVAMLYNSASERETVLTRLQGEKAIIDISGQGRKKDGSPFWASLNVQFIYDNEGSVTGTEGFIRDATERTALEQAIQDTNKKLNLLNSITRHDVANQLTALRGYAQLAELSNPDPVVLDFLQKIEAASDMIAHQIEFTKAYQELGEKTPAWFRLEEIVERTARPEVSFSKTCCTIEVFADPMIERVFYNLFDNAIRHGEHVTMIGIRCERAPDGLVIYVEDDGTGVVPEEKEKIFEKGYGKNTGFGLFLAREILATTGITIRETGYVGVGARFEITVPKEMWRVVSGGK